MDVLQAVERTIIEEQLFVDGETIVVAVSGGPDSVVLLHMLHLLSLRHNWRLVAAHVNHQFRGEESEREAQAVSDLACELNVPVETVRIDVPAYIREHQLNPQEAAREKRYDFLVRTANRYHANKVALAHHADDQSETVLMRLLRGTGPSGLAGMSQRRMEKNVELIRPLLRIYKSELINYAERHRLTYCTDSSNLERKYFRNRIRLDVMPFLKEYNRNLPASLNRLAETIREEDEYMDAEAHGAFRRLVYTELDGYGFAAADFQLLHVALQRRLIKLILSYLSPGKEMAEYYTIEKIRQIALRPSVGTQYFDVYGRVQCAKEYDRVYLQIRLADDYERYSYVLNDVFPGRLFIPQAQAVVNYDCIDGALRESHTATTHANEAYFDMDAIVLPLMMRNRRSGDRMSVMGLNGSKKVKDIFIDDKIVKRKRDRIPLLVDGSNTVLWIPGVRRSAHALLSKRSCRILHLSCSVAKLQDDSAGS